MSDPMSVKRYDPSTEYIGTGEYIGSMDELPDGDYVAFEDYARLQRELAEARELIASATNESLLDYDVWLDWKARRDAFLAAAKEGER